MNSQIFQLEYANTMLTKVHEGMPVFDLIGERLGTVKYVQFPEDKARELVAAGDRRLEKAAPTLKTRLLTTGYIKVAGGLLRPTCYPTATQIACVMDIGVQLDVMRDELIML